MSEYLDHSWLDADFDLQQYLSDDTDWEKPEV